MSQEPDRRHDVALDRATKAQAKFKSLAPRFKQVFHRDLRDFWNTGSRIGVFAGFDIRKFDDEVIQSGTGSMQEAILARWGEPALALIRQIIGG